MAIALTSPTGKLGGAVLHAILANNLINPKDLVVCTSSEPSDPRFNSLQDQGVQVRYANFDKPSSLTSAYKDCTSLFLVSTPRISMDYNDAPLWQGREAHHRAAIDAAISVGVKHIYYTSLAFANPSKASVMRAHIRTEKCLTDLASEGKVSYTIIREGLYNESWPLYFGYFFGLKQDERDEVLVAGDGPVAWTAIEDMAYATAKILSEEREKWAGKTFYLSQRETRSLEDIAKTVSELQGREVGIKVVSRKEYEDHYVTERRMERASVEWWSSTYEALEDGECEIEDDTLQKLLEGRMPKPLEETMKEMYAAGSKA